MLIVDEKTSSLKHRKQIMVNYQISKNLLPTFMILLLL
jgi:hypothetical protein